MNNKVISMYYHSYCDNRVLNDKLAKLAEATAKARIWLNSIDERTYKFRRVKK